MWRKKRVWSATSIVGQAPRAGGVEATHVGTPREAREAAGADDVADP